MNSEAPRTDEIFLDVRGLPPCEPLELALAAARRLEPGQRLRIIHWRDPFPLYAILEREGLAHSVVRLSEHLEITVWRPLAPAGPPR